MSGLGKLCALVAAQGYIARVRLPFPLLGYALAPLAEIGRGFLLLIGYRTSVVAALLGAFTLATAVFFHNNFADQNQMIHFLKNIMIIGGLLQLVAFGAPAFSLDARRSSVRRQVRANRRGCATWQLLQKNATALKATKDAIRRVGEMTCDNAEDYLVRAQEAANF